VILRIDWCHCHPSTATPHATATYCHPCHCHFFFIATLPILPLPLSNLHHSNRRDLANRLVPLPPMHCHPPRRCRILPPVPLPLFFLLTTLPILPLPLSNLHHSNRRDLANRLVPLPPCHCHPPRRCHILPPVPLPLFVLLTTLPILPLPRCNRYHSNRLDLANRLVPLPPCHCHSPRHCHTLPPVPLPLFFLLTTLPILLLPHCNRYHSNRLDLANRLVPLPPCHCHTPRRCQKLPPVPLPLFLI
jgi:hypothetical protein